MKKLKPILLLLLVFAAGVVVGVAGTRTVVRNFLRRAVHEPDFLRLRVERDLVRQLDLTAEQTVRVAQALREVEDGIKSAANGVKPQLRTVFENANAEIEAALTPAQREKYHELQRKNRARWDLRR